VSADIERLQAVVNRLAPLSAIITGDLIRAQDWNALVLAVVDVARAVLAEGPVTVPPHEHLGQVKAEWLDPRFSTTLQRGPLADPDAAARLTGAEHSVTAVGGRVTNLAAEISQLRLRLNEVTARDLERASQVSSLGLRVSGVNDARDDVQAMRTTLASVQDALGRALAVAQQLTVNGVPVDVGTLGQRIADLETFRDGLREPDGSLLDGARLHADLQGATATLVSNEQLAAALAGHATVLTPEQVAGISDTIATSLRADFKVQTTQLGDSIRAETQRRLDGLHDIVSGAVADALPSLRDSVLAGLRPELTSAIAVSASDLQQKMDQRLADTGGTIRTEFDGKLTGVRGEVLGAVATEVGQQLAVGLQPVQTAITDLTTKGAATSAAVADLATKSDATALGLNALTTSVTVFGQRVDAVAVADASALASLDTALRTDLAGRDAQIAARIDSSINTLDKSMQKRLADNTAALRLEIKKNVIQR